MISSFQGKQPKIAPTAFIEDTARVIGDVEIGENSSVWFYTVIRGDVHYIRIAGQTNIQDHCVLHVENNLYPLIVGHHVTVGHSVILHGCRIEPWCLIGIGAMLLNNAVIGEYSIIAAGSLIPENMVIPPQSMVMGVPGKIVRNIRPEEIERIKKSAENYIHYKDLYSRDGYGTCN